MHVRRPIRSFVLRAGRVTDAQERALKELWPRYGLDFTDTRIDLDAAFGRTRPALSRDRIRHGRGHRQLAEEQSRDRLPGRRGASRRGRPPAAARHRETASRIFASSATMRQRSSRGASPTGRSIRDPDLLPRSLAQEAPPQAPLDRCLLRRLILARKLRPRGVLRLATDWQDYAEQMLEVCNACRGLRSLERRTATTCRGPNSGRPPASSAAASGLGHGVWDLAYERVEPSAPAA